MVSKKQIIGSFFAFVFLFTKGKQLITRLNLKGKSVKFLQFFTGILTLFFYHKATTYGIEGGAAFFSIAQQSSKCDSIRVKFQEVAVELYIFGKGERDIFFCLILERELFPCWIEASPTPPQENI